MTLYSIRGSVPLLNDNNHSNDITEKKIKDYSIRVKFTKGELYGRLPTPKKGGAMKAKKGRGSYTRKAKHHVSY